MDIELHTDTVGSIPVVAVGGVVDIASVPQLRDALTRAVRQFAGQRVAVDLDGVHALDDVGLGVMLGVAAAARDTGGEVSFVVTNDRLRNQLARTRVDRAVDIAATVSELA